MNTGPARRRGRRRGSDFTNLADEVLELAFATDDDGFPPDTTTEGARLARGVVWSSLVAEMERDWQSAQPDAA